MKTEPLLRIKALRASFESETGPQPVLHDIELSLSAGETLGIVGESGSGKSVTSLSIMRLIDSPPISYQRGSITFGEERIDLMRLDSAALSTLRGKRIAMIFQEPMSALNPLLRCGDQVCEAITLHSQLDRVAARDRVLSLFEQVKLPDPQRAFRSHPHELSGGQLQRVMIAMAISNEPELLIADEPTTALDVTVQREIIELLKELQHAQGMAMIFISHDLGVVSQVADELLVMRHGRIVEQGPALAILQSPQADYTKGLLASRPPLHTRPHRLSTVQNYEQGRPLAGTITPAERQAAQKQLYAQEPVLTVDALHTWYPIRSGLLQKTSDYVKAVNGVSLALYPGETLGIVGESGCGKSTLGRTIIGLEQAHSGTIAYKGSSVSSMDRTQRREYTRRVQMIFQDPYSSLNPRKTVGQAISEPMEVHSILNSRMAREAKARDLLVQVGLQEEHYHRYPHEFSGGQRQRICIARTLALEPEVVICDESVSALDVSVQAQVLNLLNELKDIYGLSYLFISHDLSVVRYMSDKVLVMNKGKVEEYREADALFHSPEAEYTQRLIASAYTLD